MSEKENILRTCASIAKQGQYYRVNKYLYRDSRKRKLLAQLKSEGLLVCAGLEGKHLLYYRPQDEGAIAKAKDKHAEEMRKIHAGNVIWHENQAKENPSLADYHLREADRSRELSEA